MKNEETESVVKAITWIICLITAVIFASIINTYLDNIVYAYISDNNLSYTMQSANLKLIKNILQLGIAISFILKTHKITHVKIENFLKGWF